MTQIYDGRESFYQWDLNRKITSTEFSVGDEIHMFNQQQSQALTLSAYELDGKVVVDVPNILLQAALPIYAYKYVEDGSGAYTLGEVGYFDVIKRPKPSDYVYTETEIKCYSDLDARLTELENEPIVKSVNGVTPDENGNVNIETGGAIVGDDDIFYIDMSYNKVSNSLYALETPWEDVVEAYRNDKTLILRQASHNSNTGYYYHLNHVTADSVEIFNFQFFRTDDFGTTWVNTVDRNGYISSKQFQYCGTRSVNNILPDEDGNIELDVGTVKSVNGVSPDENGNVEIEVANEDVVLTDAQASAQLGEELLTADGWTTTGWTGSFADGFTHTSGNTNSLKFAMPSGITGKKYQVSFACNEEISTTSLQVRIGNSELFELYGQFGVDVQGGVGLTAVDDSPLEFVPSSTFTGRIYNISVKEITDISEPYFEVKDESGNTAFEMRVSDPNTDNVFIGTESGQYITSGTKNVGLGLRTLRNNTSGFWNVAIGSQTLEANNVGSRNIGIGNVALVRNTTGHRNIAIGTYSMQNNTTGHHNIAIGADCMDLNKTGYDNVAIGFGALRATESSYDNVAIGYVALSADTTGIANTALGAFAGYSLKTGNSCTAIGQKALYNNNGHYNTAIGAEAGSTNKTGIRNTYIGKGANATDTWFNDCIAIGQGAKVSKSGQTMIGGANTTETVVKGNLIVQGTDGVNRQIVFNADGTCSWTTV